jgi:hypothetical protein
LDVLINTQRFVPPLTRLTQLHAFRVILFSTEFAKLVIQTALLAVIRVLETVMMVSATMDTSCS